MTNRPVCDVLEEMRECFINISISLLPSLIEEVPQQIVWNRNFGISKIGNNLKMIFRVPRLELKRIKEEKEKMEDFN